MTENDINRLKMKVVTLEHQLTDSNNLIRHMADRLRTLSTERYEAKNQYYHTLDELQKEKEKREHQGRANARLNVRLGQVEHDATMYLKSWKGSAAYAGECLKQLEYYKHKYEQLLKVVESCEYIVIKEE